MLWPSLFSLFLCPLSVETIVLLLCNQYYLPWKTHLTSMQVHSSFVYRLLLTDNSWLFDVFMMAPTTLAANFSIDLCRKGNDTIYIFTFRASASEWGLLQDTGICVTELQNVCVIFLNIVTSPTIFWTRVFRKVHPSTLGHDVLTLPAWSLSFS